MRDIRRAADDELYAMCQHLEYVPSSGFKGITLTVDGKPSVIVGYDNWTTGAVSMHIWVIDPKAMGRDILREAFGYPFKQCDRAVVMGFVRSDNQKALDFDLRCGFVPVGEPIKDAYGPGVDMHILQLPRHQCKWI